MLLEIQILLRRNGGNYFNPSSQISLSLSLSLSLIFPQELHFVAWHTFRTNIPQSLIDEFRMLWLPWTTHRKVWHKWPFGRPPVLGGCPNGHFVPYFSMRRPGYSKHAKLVYNYSQAFWPLSRSNAKTFVVARQFFAVGRRVASGMQDISLPWSWYKHHACTSLTAVKCLWWVAEFWGSFPCVKVLSTGLFCFFIC